MFGFLIFAFSCNVSAQDRHPSDLVSNFPPSIYLFHNRTSFVSLGFIPMISNPDLVLRSSISATAFRVTTGSRSCILLFFVFSDTHQMHSFQQLLTLELRYLFSRSLSDVSSVRFFAELFEVVPPLTRSQSSSPSHENVPLHVLAITLRLRNKMCRAMSSRVSVFPTPYEHTHREHAFSLQTSVFR